MISRAGRFKISRIGSRAGFTFIELMIALLIMGFLLTAIYRVFTSQESMFRAQEQAAEMQENIRATTEFLHQEMSWLGYSVSDLAVVYAGASQIIYKSNLPNTGSTVSFIRYTYDATNESIMRAVESTLVGAQNNNNLKVLANDVRLADVFILRRVWYRDNCDTSGQPDQRQRPRNNTTGPFGSGGQISQAGLELHPSDGRG